MGQGPVTEKMRTLQNQDGIIQLRTHINRVKQRKNIPGNRRGQVASERHLETNRHGKAVKTMVWCCSGQTPKWQSVSSKLNSLAAGAPQLPVGKGSSPGAQQVNPDEELPASLICFMLPELERTAAGPKHVVQKQDAFHSPGPRQSLTGQYVV